MRNTPANIIESDWAERNQLNTHSNFSKFDRVKHIVRQDSGLVVLIDCQSLTYLEPKERITHLITFDNALLSVGR